MARRICDIVYDISKAHRLVPVREVDWGLQAFQLTGEQRDEDEVIRHCCGTFGIASAAYWWARVSAAMAGCSITAWGCSRPYGTCYTLMAAWASLRAADAERLSC